MKKILTITLALTALIGLIATGTITAADFDGDSRDDITIFRSSSGLWAVRGVTRVYFGSSSDDPAAGDYNGDGIADIGIFRGDSGLWAIRDVTRVYFGGSTDEPVTGGAGGQRIYDYVVKVNDGADLVAALESDIYGSVFVPAGVYSVSEVINVDNVVQINGEQNYTRINMATDCYLSIEAANCTIEKIRVNGGSLNNGTGNFDVSASNVTVFNCRSTSSDHSGFSFQTTADYVTFNNCYARNASYAGFYTSSTGYKNSRLVSCLAKDCQFGFRYVYNLSSCYADSATYIGFSYCGAITASQAYNCSTYGFFSCANIGSCRVDGNGTTVGGFRQCAYVSSSYAISCTTNWDGGSKIDGDSCNN